MVFTNDNKKRLDKVCKTIIVGVLSAVFLYCGCIYVLAEEREGDFIILSGGFDIVSPDENWLEEGSTGKFELSLHDIGGIKAEADVAFHCAEKSVLNVSEDGRWEALETGTATVWIEVAYTEDTLKRVQEANPGKELFTYDNSVMGYLITVTSKDVTGGLPIYRLYNLNSGEHFYTSNRGERKNLISLGWADEGIGWYGSPNWKKPVYRLYNPNVGDHHYTINASEHDALQMLGWISEGCAWNSDVEMRVPLYRQYNPNAVSGSHNYTTSKGENDWLVGLGWKSEGICWYGVN